MTGSNRSSDWATYREDMRRTWVASGEACAPPTTPTRTDALEDYDRGDLAPGELPLWARVAGRFANAGYHEPSAADARRRIVSFFDAHLKS